MKIKFSLPLFLSLFFFILAIIFPTYCIENRCSDYLDGLGLVLIGWLSILNEDLFICWLANPLLLLAWVLPNIKVKRIFACVAVLCALYFLNFETMIINEAGHKGKITSYGLGYYFWITSMIVYFIGITFKSLKFFNITNNGAAR